MTTQDDAKRNAGRLAIEHFVRPGMKLGLGSGTTSHYFVRELAKHVADGLQLTCTTTSSHTTALAESVGIRITPIDDIGEIDLTIDGPDEIDRQFRMIKGGGACLLWEKIVAHASKTMITICDDTKIVDQLGRFPLPVEVVQFGWAHTSRLVEKTLRDQGIANLRVVRRERNGSTVVTDSGNYILDCSCEQIPTPESLETALNTIPGVVENGLFTRESSGMVVGRLDGSAEVIMRPALRYGCRRPTLFTAP